MSAESDIARIKEQELGLEFAAFDEATAWAIGSSIRERAVRETLGLVCEIRLWDRTLFYCSMPGTTGDNIDWVRRKAWVVKRFAKSSYRAMLENKGERLYAPGWGFDPADYALAGGAFPIRMKGVGVVGAVTISGLHERLDHGIVVDALCDQLAIARDKFALSAE